MFAGLWVLGIVVFGCFLWVALVFVGLTVGLCGCYWDVVFLIGFVLLNALVLRYDVLLRCVL